MKNHKIADKSASTDAREKNKHVRGLEFYQYYGVFLTKFENTPSLFNKFSHWIVVTTNLFTGWNVPNEVKWIDAYPFSGPLQDAPLKPCFPNVRLAWKESVGKYSCLVFCLFSDEEKCFTRLANRWNATNFFLCRTCSN